MKSCDQEIYNQLIFSLPDFFKGRKYSRWKLEKAIGFNDMIYQLYMYLLKQDLVQPEKYIKY